MDSQIPFDVAVVVQTILRPHLKVAIESIYQQDFFGRIHIVIGIDKQLGDRQLLDDLIAKAPNNCHITVIDPGYSTSARHGGLYSCYYGGALRTILTYLANSQYIAYLDDDDWFAPNHLSSLLSAIQGKDWAFSYRWYAHPYKKEGLCIDEWEALGPDAGVFKGNYGGFVPPSCLMVDKLKCHMIFPLWAVALYPSGDGEDRRIFKVLTEEGYSWGKTGQATSYYTLDPKDGLHKDRVHWIRSKNIELPENGWQDAPNRIVFRK